MRYQQPHIIIDFYPDGVAFIQVDDYELFDFISDYLSEEYSMEFEYTSLIDKLKKYSMFFPERYSFQRLKDAIQKLDKNEIEKIYRLNNK